MNFGADFRRNLQNEARPARDRHDIAVTHRRQGDDGEVKHVHETERFIAVRAIDQTVARDP